VAPLPRDALVIIEDLLDEHLSRSENAARARRALALGREGTLEGMTNRAAVNAELPGHALYGTDAVF
jgi:hypothetical protein